MPLNWYVNPDLPDNVINQQPSSVIADLMGVMEHIITEGEEEAYQSEIQYRNAQSEFRNDSTRGLHRYCHIQITNCREHYLRLGSNG